MYRAEGWCHFLLDLSANLHLRGRRARRTKLLVQAFVRVFPDSVSDGHSKSSIVSATPLGNPAADNMKIISGLSSATEKRRHRQGHRKCSCLCCGGALHVCIFCPGVARRGAQPQRRNEKRGWEMTRQNKMAVLNSE